MFDSDYSARIMLGALTMAMAMAMAMQQFGPMQRRDAQKLLTRMRRAARREDIQEWLDAHDAFHGMFEAARCCRCNVNSGFCPSAARATSASANAESTQWPTLASSSTRRSSKPSSTTMNWPLSPH